MWLAVAVTLLLLGGYAYTRLAGWRTRMLMRRTERRVKDMYDQYADSLRKQRQDAKEHGGESADGPPKA